MAELRDHHEDPRASRRVVELPLHPEAYRNGSRRRAPAGHADPGGLEAGAQEQQPVDSVVELLVLGDVAAAVDRSAEVTAWTIPAARDSSG